MTDKAINQDYIDKDISQSNSGECCNRETAPDLFKTLKIENVNKALISVCKMFSRQTGQVK